jgi:hypothetical protein
VSGLRRALLQDLALVEARLDSLRAVGGHRDLWREYREQQGEDVFGRVVAALRVDPVHPPARKGAPVKGCLAALLCATTSVSNGWLALKLRVGKPASVSRYLRRFRLAQGHQTREFQHLLSIVNT